MGSRSAWCHLLRILAEASCTQVSCTSLVHKSRLHKSRTQVSLSRVSYTRLSHHTPPPPPHASHVPCIPSHLTQSLPWLLSQLCERRVGWSVVETRSSLMTRHDGRSICSAERSAERSANSFSPDAVGSPSAREALDPRPPSPPLILIAQTERYASHEALPPTPPLAPPKRSHKATK